MAIYLDLGMQCNITISGFCHELIDLGPFKDVIYNIVCPYFYNIHAYNPQLITLEYVWHVCKVPFGIPCPSGETFFIVTMFVCIMHVCRSTY